MSQKVIIIGASGHGKVIADIVLQSGDELLGFLDDGKCPGDSVLGFPILGDTSNCVDYPEAAFVIAIGNAMVREQIAEKMGEVRWYTAIHPWARVSDLSVTIGEGTVIMSNAVVNPGAEIGRHCILNTASVVEHDNKLDDYVHVSVGAKLAGTVSVGKRSWIGIGAVVSNNLTVCADCMIGAGAVVVRNIEKAGTYVGVPAKKIK